MYVEWEEPIGQLANKTATLITYNFEEQYFDINGETYKKCNISYVIKSIKITWKRNNNNNVLTPLTMFMT
ncbi:hypothetical protein BDF14DRAFT_341270 [Spinellus fusiger]|nr:hypothetical protein BDF14DRAFT_341270 [Spinellus fusiger]